ncbi:hypothetical protein [Nocardia wallacei]|uniref:hypothetical protein n=1 Tax=Nocardia wallacei TaxID=480035 RepID=UPI002454DFF2|nr:hypothetical protein [Nocardia wallacei]
MADMRFGISIPQFHPDGDFDPAAFRTHLRRVEELGFDSGWTQEQVLTPPNFADVAVSGTPADCIRGVRQVADAGADLILFTPMFDEPEQTERLAAEVIPQLR